MATKNLQRLRKIKWTPEVQWSRFAGLIALSTVAGMDLAATAAGLLTNGPIREGNPVAAAVITESGFIGLAALSLLGVVLIVSAVEFSVWFLKLFDPPYWGATAVRAFGYGPITVFWLIIAIRNIRLVASAGGIPA